MHYVDEQHEVAIVTLGGDRIEIGTARLNEDGTSVSDLRRLVANEACRSFATDGDAVVVAFDRAFARVESRPGSAVMAGSEFEHGTVVVERRLAA